VHAAQCIEAADRDDARRAENRGSRPKSRPKSRKRRLQAGNGKDQADRECSDLSACLLKVTAYMSRVKGEGFVLFWACYSNKKPYRGDHMRYVYIGNLS